MTNNNRILVVDDDPIVSSYLKSLLEDEGFKVTVLENGDSVLETIHKEQINLVLLDILLPGTDGYAILGQINNSCNVPVIMVTCLTDPVSAAKSFNIGADDFIRKPFMPRVIVAQINSKLKRACD